jgi:hypothetical protein
LCHFDKLAGLPTAQQQRTTANYFEGLTEVLSANHALQAFGGEHRASPCPRWPALER